MRTILQSLALLVASACTSPTTILKPSKQEKPTIEQRVEQEVRKMDDFVEWYVQSDYTKPKREFASFALVDDKEMQKKRQGGRNSAEYDLGSEQVHVPFSNGKDSQNIEDKAVSAIIHEVTHSITDHKDDEGIIFWQDYKGPTNIQIKGYVVQVTQREEFKPLKNKIDLEIKLIELERIIEDNKSQYFMPLIKTSHTIREFTNKLGQIKDNITHLSKSEKEQLRISFNELATSSNESLKLLKEYRTYVQNLGDQKEIDFKKATKDLYDFDERFKQYDSLIKDTKIFEIVYTCHFDIINLRKVLFEYTKSSLQDAKNKEDKDKIKLQFKEDLLTTLDGIYGCIDGGYDFEFSNFSNDINSITLMASMSKAMITQKITQNILGNHHEVFARMVDSMYKLYLDDNVTSVNFKLKPQDLEFLSQFEYQGKPLFKKGIEKYQVALGMLEEGQAPKQIKATLDQATDFEYKGITYCWHDNDFTIEGKIPQTDY